MTKFIINFCLLILLLPTMTTSNPSATNYQLTDESYVSYEAKTKLMLVKTKKVTGATHAVSALIQWPEQTSLDSLQATIIVDAATWVFLIEAVTSHGPISPKRHHELTEMFAQCPHDCIYVTAFLTFADFRKYAGDIAWETECRE